MVECKKAASSYSNGCRCPDCSAAHVVRMKEWRANNRDKVNAYAAKHRASNKAFIKRKRDSNREKVQALKNRPCQDCNRSFPPYVMDFDHRDPSTKSFEISNCMTRRFEILLTEIAKCDVVCANCHRIRTHRRKRGEL